jgi:hypothetical protein
MASDKARGAAVKPMLAAFTFEEGGRTYTCTPEQRGDPSRGSWWWFTVSGDPQRYAQFEAKAGDTRSSVRARILEYYERRLWVRAQPVVPRQAFGHPKKTPAEPPAPPST